MSSTHAHHRVEYGRLGELGEAAASFRLGLYIMPALFRNRPEEDRDGWDVGVLSLVERESLGVGTTLAEAVEASFLPLNRYAREATARRVGGAGCRGRCVLVGQLSG